MQPKIVDFQINIVTTQNVQNFSVYVNIQKDLPDLFVHITSLIDSGNENFDMIYLNKTLSVCKFLDNKKLNIFLWILFQVASEYVELPKRCPLLKVESHKYLI